MFRAPKSIAEWQPDVLAEPGLHWPFRPAWTCDADGEAWPCAKLRAHLLATTVREDIALVMGAEYARAGRELDHLTEEQLHRRFFAWHQFGGWRPPGGL